MKFCEEVNIQIVPSIDISNDVAELLDVLTPIKEYLDLFKGASKFINIGPRLSSLLTCMENKNPFGLDSSQSMMLCSYLFHNGDAETNAELDKFDRYVLMEYGLKSGADFASKANNLYKSGLQYFYCIGNSNWNRFRISLFYLFQWVYLFYNLCCRRLKFARLSGRFPSQPLRCDRSPAD